MPSASSSGARNHPPKPRLTIRVGITGHRPEKLPDDSIARIERDLVRVFNAIAAAGARIVESEGGAYASEALCVRLVSGFAEGVDRIAVKLRPAGWEAEAVLPFPRSEFARDFATSREPDGRDGTQAFENALREAVSVTELPAPTIDRDAGYQRMGTFMLRQIDLLVAVWDGEKPKPGGTGFVAKDSVEQGIPVVWIDALQDRPPSMLSVFDADGLPIGSGADCTKGPLHTALKHIFELAADPADSNAGHERSARVDGRASLRMFLSQTWPRLTFWAAFDILRRLCEGRLPRLWIPLTRRDTGDAQWDAFAAAAPAAGPLSDRISAILKERFAWADALAIRYAHVYRSTYVLANILAFLAVATALSGIFAEETENPLLTKTILVAIEFCFVSGIIQLIRFGHRQKWHERWLSYRLMAESLRQMRFLAYIGEYGRIRTEAISDDSNSWVLWYVRATARELGVPSAHLEPTYQWQLLDAVLKHEIQEQIVHNRHSRHGSERMNHVLHQIGATSFYTALALMGAFLLCWCARTLALHNWLGGPAVAHELEHVLEAVKPWMVVFAAGLPALGAAVTSIRVQGDFAGAARRSAATSQSLHRLVQKIGLVSNAPDLAATTNVLLETAGILTEDLAAWQELYGRKQLTLPS